MNGLIFNNGEATFQSHKDPSRAAEFVGLTFCCQGLGRSVKLRRLGRSKRSYHVSSYSSKVSQNLHLKKKLLATGDKDLCAGNDWNDKC